ncbi:MAG: hypothetical protein ACOH5I_17265 [Oligoflexus sp.]
MWSHLGELSQSFQLVFHSAKISELALRTVQGVIIFCFGWDPHAAASCFHGKSNAPKNYRLESAEELKYILFGKFGLSRKSNYTGETFF